MKGAIVTEELRSSGYLLMMDIDESDYSSNVTRQVTRMISLSGAALVTDWGVSEGNRTIRIGNALLTKTEYELLLAIQEDNSYNCLFGYKTDLWKVVIENAAGIKEGSKYRVSIVLTVEDKYTALETA